MELVENFYIKHDTKSNKFIAHEIKKADINLSETLISDMNEGILQVPYEFASCLDKFHLPLQNISYWKMLDNFEITGRNSVRGLGECIGSNMSDDEFCDNVEKIKHLIYQGIIYQTNLTRKFFFHNSMNAEEWVWYFIQKAQANPRIFNFMLKTGGKIIISFSPERFLSYHKPSNTLTTSPIKGTKWQESDMSMKNNAEHNMIVDVSRNDFSKIADEVWVQNHAYEQQFGNISHIISDISCKPRSTCTFYELLQATFPPPSMTGAPKISAVNNVRNIEKYDRGDYSGSVFIFNENGFDSNIMIRSLIIEGDGVTLQCGGGITYYSDAKNELEEVRQKLLFLYQNDG